MPIRAYLRRLVAQAGWSSTQIVLHPRRGYGATLPSGWIWRSCFETPARVIHHAEWPVPAATLDQSADRVGALPERADWGDFFGATLIQTLDLRLMEKYAAPTALGLRVSHLTGVSDLIALVTVLGDGFPCGELGCSAGHCWWIPAIGTARRHHGHRGAFRVLDRGTRPICGRLPCRRYVCVATPDGQDGPTGLEFRWLTQRRGHPLSRSGGRPAFVQVASQRRWRSGRPVPGSLKIGELLEV